MIPAGRQVGGASGVGGDDILRDMAGGSPKNVFLAHVKRFSLGPLGGGED